MSVEFDRKKYSLQEYRIFWEVETGKLTELDDPLLGLKISDRMNRLQRCEQIKGLDKLTQLQYLTLNSSSISEISGLDNLINLQYLSIRGGLAPIYMKHPKGRLSRISGLENLKALKVLRIFGHQITEITGLENLVNLQELDLRYNKITKIKGLQNARRLQNLYLGFNQITKIEGLQDLKELQCLNLGENPIYEWAKSKFGGVTRHRSDQYIALFKQPQAIVEYCRSLIKNR